MGGVEFIRKGTHKRRPYNNNNSMDVVWHNNKLIYFGIRIIHLQLIPDRLDHFPCVIQRHRSICYRPENTLLVLCANGDKIGPCL